MALEITLVPPPPGPRIYRHRYFRRARDFDRRTYRRRRMGGRYGETYIIAERPVVFPPGDYCHCNPRPGCIPGPAPCDFGDPGMPEVRRVTSWSPGTRRTTVMSGLTPLTSENPATRVTTVPDEFGEAPTEEGSRFALWSLVLVGLAFGAYVMTPQPQEG